MTTDEQATPEPAAGGLVGTVIADRYRVERPLGEGGMGAVYLAEHTLMHKRMALKVLHREVSALPEAVARFEREAMAAAHIDHPHVAAATDFGKLPDGSFFLVLEYIEGRNLRDVIAGRPLAPARALGIARQIAEGLARAHALGIVHRDLKPENVMLVERDGDADFVKVLDFGIAKVPIGELMRGDMKGGPRTALTQAGMVFGTPEYMPPEQAMGLPIDHRADLYALGVLLYEMLAGLTPFASDNPVSVLALQVTADPPSFASRNPPVSVPPSVEEIVQRLLRKNAAERFADARELIAALDGALEEIERGGKVSRAFAPTEQVRAVEVRDYVRDRLWARVTREATPLRIGVLLAVLAAIVWALTPSHATGHRAAPAVASSAPARVSAERPVAPTAVATAEPPAGTASAEPKDPPSPRGAGEPAHERTRPRRTGPGGIYIPPPRTWFK